MMQKVDFKEHLLAVSQQKFNNYESDVKKQMTKVNHDIERKLQIRYVKYFKHWRDYDLLTCILAMIGLILAVVEVRIRQFLIAYFSTNLDSTTKLGRKEALMPMKIL